MRLTEIQMMMLGDISNSSTTFKMLVKDWMNGIRTSKPYLVGKINQQYKIGVVDNNTRKIVAAYDLSQDKFAAFIQLQHYNGAASNIFEELVIGADKEYRGLGLASKMYQVLIVDEGYIIVSDVAHSRGGRSTWEKLAQEPGVDVFGYNEETKKVFQVDVEDWFNEDVYDSGLNDEIDDLQRELSQLEFSPEPDEDRKKQIEKELEDLEQEKSNTVNNIRLFAARKRK